MLPFERALAGGARVIDHGVGRRLGGGQSVLGVRCVHEVRPRERAPNPSVFRRQKWRQPMTDARTTRAIAQGIVSIAIVFVFAAVLGACGDGTGTGGDAGDTTERGGSTEAAGTERYVLPGE